MGLAIHETIEHWEKTGRPGLDETIRHYQSIYDRTFRETKEQQEFYTDVTDWLTGSRKTGTQDVNERRTRGAEHVENYVTWALAHETDWQIAMINGEPAVELEFNIKLGDVDVTGYIDQVVETSEGVYPRDIKTGSRIPENSFQLAVYAEALRQEHGVPCTYGSFAMTKNKTDEIEHFRGVKEYTTSVLTTMFTEFDTAERANLYIPRPGDSCRTCPVIDFCRVNGDPVLAEEYATNTQNMTCEGETS